MKKEARHVSRASAQKTSGTSEESAKTVKNERRRNGGKTKATRDNKFVLKRQWDILQALTTSKGLTLEEMAALFDAGAKRQRDLKTLEYAFGEFRTKNEAHGRKRYFYDGNLFFFFAESRPDEFLSIYVGQTLMTRCAERSSGTDSVESREN